MEVIVLGVIKDSLEVVAVTMEGGIIDWVTVAVDEEVEVLGSSSGGGGAMSPVEVV